MPLFEIDKGAMVSFLLALRERKIKRAGESRSPEKEPKMSDLKPFFPYLAEILDQMTTGGGGEEASFEASVDHGGDEGEREEAIERCQREGVLPSQLAKALVEPVVLRAAAFGDLSSDTIAGIEATLTTRLNEAFEECSKISI